MINYDDAEKALRFLVNTDIDFGRAKALYDGLYEQRKTIRAMVFLKTTGSAALRMETALASNEYKEHPRRFLATLAISTPPEDGIPQPCYVQASCSSRGDMI